MKLTTPIAALFLAGLAVSMQPADAQEVDAYVGLGAARDGSSGAKFDTFGDGILQTTPKMGGVFPDFGVNLFFNQHVGIGWSASWRWSPAEYAGLDYRSTFHAFDAIFQPAPIHANRIVPEFRAGIGLVNVHFEFDDQTACDQVPGCPGSRHFLAHVAGAARLYVTRHIFLRPAVDIHYVNDFFLFKSNWVPRYSMSLGYSFGKETERAQP
jgi:hypothetical protein